MKTKSIFRLGAAAALTITGVGTASTISKTVSATTFNSAIKRVKINYLPGRGLKIYTSYNRGRFMGYRAKAGTIWNVTRMAIDRRGNLWYMVGDNEWIQARYTLDIRPKAKKRKNKKPKKTKRTSKRKSPLTQVRKRAKKTIKRIKPKAKKKTIKKAKPKAKASKKSLKRVKPKPRVNKKAVKRRKPKASKKAKLRAKKARIKKARRIVNRTLHPSSQAPKGRSIVALAKQQLGKPYVWGATGPYSFDCSGLVQYVYGRMGVSLPRTTYDQVKVGTTVAMNKLRAGDLLFWGSPTAPYHVAIYIGHNQYVNSATPEQGTILQNISSYYYPSIAKRVL